MTQSKSDYTGTNTFMQFQYTPVTNTNQPQNTQPVIMRRRLGSTTYRVNVHFSSTSRETMNDKILRMVKNEASGK